MLTAILPPLGVLLGVTLGAALQYYFGRTLEGRKQLALQRAQAYVDYFKAVALVAQHGGGKDHLAMVADAKVRVCIYGSPTVIRCLSAFESAGAVINTTDGAAAIMELLRAMRNDTGMGDSGIGQQDFQRIVLGPKFK
jgi:hypothetical protein